MTSFSRRHLVTERLILHPITIDDSDFILKLVNTPGWLQFIGDRNIKSIEDAEGYIQKILANPRVFYKVVKLKGTWEAIGVITFLKRAHLRHFDLGFAFMPGHYKKGYAYEAALMTLKAFVKEHRLKKLHGITNPTNISSIRLLETLGFVFDKELQIDNKTAEVYTLMA